jgi:hypothetical protein
LRLVALDPTVKLSAFALKSRYYCLSMLNNRCFIDSPALVWSREGLDPFCLGSADPSVSPLVCLEGFRLSVSFGVSTTIETTRGASSLVLPLLGFNLMGSARAVGVLSFVEEFFPLFSRAEPAALP